MIDIDAHAVAECATATRFSGTVSAVVRGEVLIEEAYGLGDRRHGIGNTLSTRFGIASGTKGFTALTIMSLVEQGALALDTTARSLLGIDLPLIDQRVTVEHLLAHRSGIGDYLDESLLDDATDYIMTIPIHRFATTDGYLPELEGHPQVSAPGETFAYNNGGYVVLAVLAERATGRTFHDLVTTQVFEPAGMTGSAFLRSDDLPSDAAIGYLSSDGGRTNVLHLPVVGSGDGGAYSTVGDMKNFWSALASGAIVGAETLQQMTTRHSVTAAGKDAYGLGLWLSPTESWWLLQGSDAGVSFMSRHDAATETTWTVMSNTTDGAWPLARLLAGTG